MIFCFNLRVYKSYGSDREKARTQCDSSPPPPPPFYNLTNAPEWNWSKLRNQPALYSFPNIYTVWISNHEHHDLQCKHGNQWKVKFSGQVTVRNFQEKEAVSARVRSISKSMQYCHMTRAAPCAVSLWNDKRFNDWVGLSKAGLGRKILCFRS